MNSEICWAANSGQNCTSPFMPGRAVLSVLASRVLADRMQGMGTGDPVLFVLIPALLVVAALSASFLPANSATRIQPMEALRHD